MPVTVSTNIGSSSAFAEKVLNASRSQATRLLNDVGREAVRRADQIVEREFNTARPENRRHGGARLKGSFTSTVARGSGRVLAVLSLSSDAPAVKVNSLNFGSRPHQIGAAGQKLVFPAPNTLVSGFGFKPGAPSFKRRKRNQEGATIVVRGPVNHPGTFAHNFMKRAMDQAVAAVLRKAR